jgi:DNA polymerase I-like protein with 3'-5' exonuclease and polymerase domains
MDLITLDFETYYAQDYSLTKLTTEEYIRDPRFQAIGVSLKVNGTPAEWVTGPAKTIIEALRDYRLHENAALAHNMMFDGAILSWRCGIQPKVMFDTLAMSRALHGVHAAHSLRALAERYGIGEKGREVESAKGKRRKDFTPQELAKYGRYCVKDTDLCYKLFKIMSKGFPKKELQLIDLTLSMFTKPVLHLDKLALEDHLYKTKAAKEALLERAGVDRKTLMSNPKFANMLEQFGVTPPMKISPTTGKKTFAFAKTDEGFQQLRDHPNPDVQTLVEARLGNKSTLEETRTQRFLDIANRGGSKPVIPVPVRYYAAHTGRWGGDDKINLQNLPSRGPNAKRLKSAIIAPEGHTLLDGDSSQIEARTLAWLAEQKDLTQAFHDGEDVYKIMAGDIYNVPVSEVNDHPQRFVGKTTILGCIAEGTPVMTDRGWVPIEQVSTADKLWDGEEWVCHQGLLPKGYKKTLNVCGLWLTPDHKILCGPTWQEAQSVAQDENMLSLALGTAADRWLSPGMLRGLGPKTQQIDEPCEYYSRSLMTYDIAYAGPRNRFVVATNAGPLIVHNCGYGMGGDKFQDQLAQFGVEVELGEAKRIIDVYRRRNAQIKLLWRHAGDFIEALHKGRSLQFGREGVLHVDHTEQGVRLPSGLWIRYPGLKAEPGEYGYDYSYKVRNGYQRIYGGKCLAGDTEILTDRGWVPLRYVTRTHRVWDGVQWVKHSGLVYQGDKNTTVVNGVRMTPDHNVLTEKGWRCASSSEGLHRAGFWLPDGSEISGDKWPTLSVDLPMQMRDGSFSGGYRRGKVCPSWGAPFVRMQSWARQQIAWYVKTPGILGMEVNAGSLSSTYTPSMAQLRCSGYQSVAAMGAVIRGVLGGHGADIPAGTDTGQERQQRRLQPGKLPLGDVRGASGEPAKLGTSGHHQGPQTDGYFQIDTAVSVEPEPVYDLLNAGPNARFVVRGSTGPFIVHNCVENVVQGIARCIVGEQMLLIAKRYRVVLTVHDSAIICVPDAEVPEAREYMERCMRTVPDWAAGLPVDCEIGVGKSYGDC